MILPVILHQRCPHVASVSYLCGVYVNLEDIFWRVKGLGLSRALLYPVPLPVGQPKLLNVNKPMGRKLVILASTSPVGNENEPSNIACAPSSIGSIDLGTDDRVGHRVALYCDDLHDSHAQARSVLPLRYRSRIRNAATCEYSNGVTTFGRLGRVFGQFGHPSI